jgi:lipoprotein NlpI
MARTLLFLILILTSAGSAAFAQTKAIEVEPSNKWGYFTRGLDRHKSGDFAGAIADFTKVIELDPNAESPKNFLDAYYNRCLEKLLLNDGAGAYEDAKYYLHLNPLYTDSADYAIIFGYLGLMKSNQTASAKTFLEDWLREFNPNYKKWAVQILKFLSGKLTDAQLLALAVDNDKLTEAHTYIGEVQLFANDRSNAVLHFQWVKANGNKDFTEYTLALIELKRLESTPK